MGARRSRPGFVSGDEGFDCIPLFSSRICVVIVKDHFQVVVSLEVLFIICTAPVSMRYHSPSGPFHVKKKDRKWDKNRNPRRVISVSVARDRASYRYARTFFPQPRAAVSRRRRPNRSSREGSCPSPLQNPPQDPTRSRRAPRILALALVMAPPHAAAATPPLTSRSRRPPPPRSLLARAAQAPVSSSRAC